MRWNSNCASASVSAAVGSSRISSRTFFESARAMTAICCMARLSSWIGRAGSMSISKASRIRRASAWRRGQSTKPKRPGSEFRYMFSATVRSGATLISCGTRTMPARSASASPMGAKLSPPTDIAPS